MMLADWNLLQKPIEQNYVWKCEQKYMKKYVLMRLKEIPKVDVKYRTKRCCWVRKKSIELNT